MQRRNSQETRRYARFQPIHSVGDILRFVELLERECKLGVAELELDHHLLTLYRLVGYAQITRRENDSVGLKPASRIASVSLVIVVFSNGGNEELLSIRCWSRAVRSSGLANELAIA